MATMSINIPNTIAPRVLDALCDRGGWDGTGDKAAFAKSVVLDYIVSVTRNFEADDEAKRAREVAATKATNEIVLT